MNNDFEHPIGTKVWWVGMTIKSDGTWEWSMCEREVTVIRKTMWFNDEKPYKQIFVSGLPCYEGDNWFDDEFQTMREHDGTEWHCSCYMCDVIFETKNEADKYMQWLERERQQENNKKL